MSEKFSLDSSGLNCPFMWKFFAIQFFSEKISFNICKFEQKKIANSSMKKTPKVDSKKFKHYSGYEGMIESIKQGNILDESEIRDLTTRAKEILQKEPNIISIKAPVTIVGDIHGQFYDLLDLLEMVGDVPVSFKRADEVHQCAVFGRLCRQRLQQRLGDEPAPGLQGALAEQHLITERKPRKHGG